MKIMQAVLGALTTLALDYHHLSQFEIGGGKRISQHLRCPIRWAASILARYLLLSRHNALQLFGQDRHTQVASLHSLDHAQLQNLHDLF